MSKLHNGIIAANSKHALPKVYKGKATVPEMREFYWDSDGVRFFPEAYEAHVNNKIVLNLRVSSDARKRDGSLKRQELFARALIKKIAPDAEIVATFTYVEGSRCGARPWLRTSIECAREANALHVSLNLSRLIRPMEYHRFTNTRAMPRLADIQWLMRLGDGVTFATLVDPFLSISEIYSISHTGRSGRNAELSDAVSLAILKDHQRGEVIVSGEQRTFSLRNALDGYELPRKKLGALRRLLKGETRQAKRLLPLLND